MPEFVVTVPIRFSDLDVFGHVNHVRYLTYCEDHRTTMLRCLEQDTGVRWTEDGFVIARVECDYLLPAALSDDTLDVGLTVDHVGRTSVRATYRLRRSRDGAEAAVSRQVLVLVDGGRPRPVTDVEREWLLRYGDVPDTVVSYRSER
ncbi:thioesterase family protein [Verrucosispora sp. WMMC514]|uniref:acyl-CoA thioesterase n=1 Tax=Verrucosispora sp. WMMC514 TaxID=3015156 RepID=UPI00248B9F6E|nr:thioesterase family protein [Verrucosispora sp. WMMC514]WBB89889.1 thioesterase family protein [Verrucosispora sp. WMMC514]